MHEAKSTLSKLVEKACSGAEVILARAGRPVVRLVPIKSAGKQRKLGAWKGKVWTSDDCFAPMSEDELALWEGE